MLYEEETSQLCEGLFEVQNEVGIGRSEEAYHQALKLWFENRDLPFTSKAPHRLLLDEQIAVALEPDFVAWNKIVLELKALPRKLHNEERVQIYDYLKCRDNRVGLLVNMGLDRVHVDRIAWDPPRPRKVENWDYWKGHIKGQKRQKGLKTRDILSSIYETYGTGYGQKVTSELVYCGLRNSGLRCELNPVCPSLYQGRQLNQKQVDCVVIEDQILLVFTALFDSNDFNISRGLSYMKSLGLRWGIAANYGKKVLQINGLRTD